MTLRSITTWHRLEPQSRSADMRQSLQARIRDSAFLLARQWQVGEFLGHDAGSPAQAHVSLSSQGLSDYAPGEGGPAQTYPPSVPLETNVERESVELGLRFAVQLGLHFEALLRAGGARASIAAYRDRFPIAANAAGREQTESDAGRYRAAVVKRVVDGTKLLQQARTFVAGGQLNPPLPDTLMPAVARALAALVTYRDQLFSEPGADGAWVPPELSYRFALSARGEHPADLEARDFGGGELDWYSVATSAQGPNAGGNAIEKEDVVVRMPVHVTFSGMPTQRWWDLEDSQIDFGELSTDLVDLPKMIVAEFALSYGGDWYELPLTLDVGCVAWVDEVLVTDTFGVRTVVAPAAATTPTGAAKWRMFSVDGAGADGLFLLPPSLHGVTDGPPIEDVLFARDDMADLAWAIEKQVRGALDAPVDGYESYMRRITQNPPPAPPAKTANGPDIYYLAGTTVPDSWYPLVPFVGPQQQLLLRRGRMLHPELAPDLDPLPPRAAVLEPGHMLLVNDRTVARAGVRVTRAFRRARWSDGSTHVWIARRRHTGRGESYAGLAFDLVRPVGPPR